MANNKNWGVVWQILGRERGEVEPEGASISGAEKLPVIHNFVNLRKVSDYTPAGLYMTVVHPPRRHVGSFERGTNVVNQRLHGGSCCLVTGNV